MMITYDNKNDNDNDNENDNDDEDEIGDRFQTYSWGWHGFLLRRVESDLYLLPVIVFLFVFTACIRISYRIFIFWCQCSIRNQALGFWSTSPSSVLIRCITLHVNFYSYLLSLFVFVIVSINVSPDMWTWHPSPPLPGRHIASCLSPDWMKICSHACVTYCYILLHFVTLGVSPS